MITRSMSVLVSAFLTLSVLLVAFGVARNVVMAWVLGCISLGFSVQLVIDCARRP